MDNTKLGSLIRALRREAGMTQRELAETLGVTDKAGANGSAAWGAQTCPFCPSCPGSLEWIWKSCSRGTWPPMRW